MKRTSLLLLFALLCSSTAFAQKEDDKEIDKVYKENYELREILSTKDNEINDLKAQIEKLTDKNKKSGKGKKNDGPKEEDAKELKRKIEELRDSITGLRAEISKEVDSQYAEDSVQIAGLIAQQVKDKDEIERLSQELFSLKKFKGLWLQELAESVDNKWMNKAYSQINQKELEVDLSQYKEFADTDEKVGNAYRKLQGLYDEYMVYAEGLKCAHSPYEKRAVSLALGRVRDLRDKLSGDKKNDITAVFKMLNDYEVTVEIFLDLLKNVDAAIKEQSSSKAAFPLAKFVIDDMEKNREAVSCIKVIPWLKEQYEIYYKGLEDDCLNIKENEAYKTIKAIQL